MRPSTSSDNKSASGEYQITSSGRSRPGARKKRYASGHQADWIAAPEETQLPIRDPIAQDIALTAGISRIIPRSSDISSIFSRDYGGAFVVGTLVGGAFIICLCQWAMQKALQYFHRLRTQHRRKAPDMTNIYTMTASPQDPESLGHEILPRVVRYTDRAPDPEVTQKVQISRKNSLFELSGDNLNGDSTTVSAIESRRKMTPSCICTFQGAEVDFSGTQNETSNYPAPTRLSTPLEVFTPSPRSSSLSIDLPTSTQLSPSLSSSFRLSLSPSLRLPSPTETSTVSAAVTQQFYPPPPSLPPPSYHTSSRHGASRSIRTLRSIGTLNSERDITTPLPEYRAASVPPYENK